MDPMGYLLPHSPGGGKSETEVSAELLFSEVSLLGSSHGLSSVSVCVLTFSTYKDTSHIGLMSNDPYDLILP